MREKLKSRRESSVIIIAEAEKSRELIVRISVPHFDFINRFSLALPLKFKASDVLNSKQAVESPWISMAGDRVTVNHF
jgi:hypothetical protein